MYKKIKVKKRNGRLEQFNPDKINKRVQMTCENLEHVSASEVVLDAQISFADKIKTTEIDRELIFTARSKIYKHPNYSLVAARLLLNCLYKEVFRESVDCDTFVEDYRSAFVKSIKRGVKAGVYTDKLLEYDLKDLAAYIQPDRDLLYHYIGIQNLYDRYFLRIDDKLIETPQHFNMRVAMGVCLSETKENRQNAVKSLYDVYSNHLASASTPTLFNSGTWNSQMSSCYLSEIGDSIDGIFDGLWQEARKSKHAGGLGFHISKIRGSGSHVKGTNGKSSGIVPWLKVYNDMLIACDQGGRRKGSGCAYLENWHIDIEDFIDLRKASGEERRRCHDLNTAVWLSSLFMKRVEEKGKWTLFCPDDAPGLSDVYGDEFENLYKEYEYKAENGEIKNHRVVDAVDLWKKILKSLFETSHPWVTFKDPSNMRYPNKHDGVVHGSNLCTEITLQSKSSKYANGDEFGQKTEVGETAVCNLASVCLPNHMYEDANGWKMDWEKLEDTIHKTVRGLDNVIDINFYPTEEAKNANMKHRPIGMGSMGWADVYQKMGIAQDSEKAVKLTHRLMEFVSYHAILASSELAKERGKYSTYDGSTWSQDKLPIDTYDEYMKWLGDDGERIDYPLKMDWNRLRKHVAEHGMRNSNVMAIAPNASIGYILGCEQSIEPPFRMAFRYENMSGNYFVINRNLVEHLERTTGEWSESISQAMIENDGDLSKIDDLDDATKDIFKIAPENDQTMLIRANAARQKFIDQAISFNLYNGGEQSINQKTGKPSLKFLHKIYTEAHRMGLKTTYYLRNKAASTTQKVNKFAKKDDSVKPEEIKQTNYQEQSEMPTTGICSIDNPETCESCQG